MLVITRPFEALARTLLATSPATIELLILEHPVSGRSEIDLGRLAVTLAAALERWAAAP
jgi:hypothetical protein